jgi:hypothetical protein
MQIKVLKEYKWLCKIGSLVVAGKEISPPEEKIITYPVGKILSFSRKKDLEGFLKFHKTLVWTYT